MNKILSVLAICAIFGVASAAFNETKTLLSADDVTKNFTGFLFASRCPQGSQVALWALNTPNPATDISSVNITRRIVDSKNFARVESINDTTFQRKFDTSSQHLYTSSHNGFVGIAHTNGTNVWITTFKADANLSDDKSFVSSASLMNVTAGFALKLEAFYFQDNFFYVVASSFHVKTTEDPTTKSTALYIQGVSYKDLKETASKTQVKINKDDFSADVVQVNCATVPGSGQPTVCTYILDTKGAVSAKNITLKGDGVAADPTTVATTPDGKTAVIWDAFVIQGGVVALVSAGEDNYASNNAGVGVKITPNVTSTIWGGSYYFSDRYLVFGQQDNKATPAVNTMYYSIFYNNGTVNTTNAEIEAGKPIQTYTSPDQILYIVYTKTDDKDKTIYIGKLFDKISDKSSATILKSAVASIFVAVALMFAF